jgi:hypothetical protein
MIIKVNSVEFLAKDNNYKMYGLDVDASTRSGIFAISEKDLPDNEEFFVELEKTHYKIFEKKIINFTYDIQYKVKNIFTKKTNPELFI